VYKVPALVAAVSAYTDCECAFTEAPGLEVVDERPAVPGYKKEKKRMRPTRQSASCSSTLGSTRASKA